MYAIQEADTVLHGLLHPHQQPREVSSPIAVGGGGGRVSYGGRGDRDSVGGRSPTRASAKSGFGRPKKSDARCVKCFTVKGRGVHWKGTKGDARCVVYEWHGEGFFEG